MPRMTPFPPTIAIKDPALRRWVVAMEENVRTLMNSVVDRDTLIELGVLSEDRGTLYNPTDTPPDITASGQRELTCSFNATGGKATGTYALGATLPANAVIQSAFYNVATAFTSAASTATIQLGIATDDEDGIVSSIAINDASTPWALGYHAAIPNGSTSTFTTKTTAQRNLQAIVGVEALTAGNLTLTVRYVIITG